VDIFNPDENANDDRRNAILTIPFGTGPLTFIRTVVSLYTTKHLS